MKIPRRFLIGTAIIIGVVILGGMIRSHIQQRAWNKEFTEQNLLPIAGWVEGFRSEHERLPTRPEFRRWADVEYENKLIDYYPDRPDFMRSWGTAGHDFVIGMWQGDWIHHYQSWDGRDFAR